MQRRPNQQTDLFVSPHFDDVALSCGGSVALAARAGGGHVVTVFAGEATGQLNEFAEFQHRRWGGSDHIVDERRTEDRAALDLLGATVEWLDFPDAIYREQLYLSDDELFGEVRHEDMGLAVAVVDSLVALAAVLRPARIYLPLAAGGHVDHRICLMAARPLLDLGLDLWLYEDFPYAASPGAVATAVTHLEIPTRFETVDISAVINNKIDAIGAYASQLPTVFRHFGPFAEVVRIHASSVSPTLGAFAERFWRPASFDRGEARVHSLQST